MTTDNQEWRTHQRGSRITETEVKTAINELQQEQHNPSVRKIREKLGRGSNKTINELRKKVLSKINNTLDNALDNNLNDIKNRITDIANNQTLAHTITTQQQEIKTLQAEKENTNLEYNTIVNTLEEYKKILTAVCEGYEQALKEIKPLKNIYKPNQKAKTRFQEIKKAHPEYSLTKIVKILTSENLLNTKNKPFDSSILSRWQREK